MPSGMFLFVAVYQNCYLPYAAVWPILLQFSANSVIASREPTNIAWPVQDLRLRKLRVSSICNESPVSY